MNLAIIQHNRSTFDLMFHVSNSFEVYPSAWGVSKGRVFDLVPLVVREIAAAHIERLKLGLAGEDEN